MAVITDPNEINKFLSMAEVVDYSTPSTNNTEPSPQEDSGTGFVDFMSSIEQRAKTRAMNFLASSVSPENSNYATSRAKQEMDLLKQKQERLGTVGTIASEIVGSAVPVIAAGMVNPAAGGAVAMGMGTTDALSAQLENEGKFDRDSATRAGMAMGTIDAAMGGLGNVARTGLAARAATKAGLPTAAPLAQRIGVNVAEDVSSSVGGEAMINLASGKKWNENLGEAALMGAVGGTALRGSLAGLNKVTNTPINQWGEKAMETLSSFRKKGLNPDQPFVDQVFNYENKSGDILDKMENANTPEEIRSAADAYVNLAGDEGGMAGAALAMRVAEKNKVSFLDSGLNVTVHDGLARSTGSRNLGETQGLSQKHMIQTGEQSLYARESRFGGKGAKERGETSDSFFEKFQEEAKDVLGGMRGSYKENINMIDDMIRLQSEAPNVDAEYVGRLKELRSDLEHLDSYIDEYVGNKKVDLSSSIKIAARRALVNSSELGLNKKLMGVDREAGSWDPILGIKAIETMNDMMKKQMSNFEHGSPSAHKSEFLGSGIAGNALDAALLASGNIGLAALRRAGGLVSKEGGAHLSQRRLRKAKEAGAARFSNIASKLTAPRSKTQAGLDSGDLGAAAKGAVDDLESAGIAVPRTEAEGATTTPEAVVPPVVTPESVPVQKSGPVPVSQPAARTASPEPTVAEPAPAKPLPRKPRKVKRAEELESARIMKEASDIVSGTPSVPATEITKVQDVTPKSRALTPDKIAKVEKAPEPTPEAPKKPVESKDMSRKPTAPKKEEVAPEAQPEAPAKVEEPTPEPKRTSSTELVTQPLKAKADEKMSVKERQANPEAYQEILKARSDLKAVNMMTDYISTKQGISPEVVMSKIHELGGIDGVRKAAEETGYKVNTPEKLRSFLSDRIKKDADAAKENASSQVKALKETASKKVEKTKKVAEAGAVESKHSVTRGRLEADGFDSDIIDQAFKNAGVSKTSDDFDATTVNKWAKRLQKERVDAAKKVSDEADEKAKSAAEVAKLKNQKWLADQYLKGLKVDSDPELRDLVDSILGKGRGKPVTEQQMQTLFNRIDKYLDDQKTAYENSYKAGTGDAPLDKARAATYASMQKTLKDNQKRADAEVEAAKKDLANATEEANRKLADYEKLFNQAEKNLSRMVDNEKLDAQIKSLSEDLSVGGASDEMIQNAIYNVFGKRTKPLSDRELKKVKAEVVSELERFMDAETASIKAEVKPQIQKMSDAELAATRGEMTLGLKGQATEPDNQAIIQAVVEELKARDMKREFEIMDAFNKVMTEGTRRRQLYPDNPEWWVSSEMKESVQAAFGTDYGSYAGNLLSKIRSQLYGDSTGTEKFYSKSQKTIDDQMKGEKITGLKDIVVREAPPAPAPKQEAPKKEVPKKEAPKQEAPKKEVPKKEAPKKEAQEPAPKVNQKAIKKPVAVVEKEPSTSGLTAAEEAAIDAIFARKSAPKKEATTSAPKTPLKAMGIGTALGKKDLGDLTSRDFEKIEAVIRNPDNGLDAKKAEKMLREGKFETVGDFFEELMKDKK